MIFRVYRDDAGEWRWRLRASNGRILADSGEGYTDRQDCLKAVDRVRAGTPDAVLHMDDAEGERRER